MFPSAIPDQSHSSALGCPGTVCPPGYTALVLAGMKLILLLAGVVWYLTAACTSALF